MRDLRSLISLTTLILMLTFLGPSQGSAQSWPVDSTITFKLNWSSFVSAGWPSADRALVEDAVLNAMSRWKMVAAARQKLKWGGITTATSPGTGELIVRGINGDASRPTAGATGGPGGISLFRHTGGVNGTPIDWRYGESTVGIEMEAVLVHEIGHAIGFMGDLSGATFPRRTMRGDYTWSAYRWGPFSADVAELRGLYGGGGRTDQALELAARSTDSGATWTNQAFSCPVVTNHQPSVVRNGSSMVAFYTTSGRSPGVRAFGTNGACGSTNFFWGGSRSAYGVSAARKDGTQDFMYAWVDYANDDNFIQVARSTDGAVSWAMVSSPNARSVGTPAIVHVPGTTSGNTWALVYARLDWTSNANMGDIVVRTTTDNGASWNPEVVLSDFYSNIHARNDVSVTHTSVSTPNGARTFLYVDFAESAPTTTNGRIRTISAMINLNGTVDPMSGVMLGTSSTALTRSAPSTARNLVRFARTYIGKDDWTSPAGAQTNFQTREQSPNNSLWGTSSIWPGSSGITFSAIATHQSQSDMWCYFVQ